MKRIDLLPIKIFIATPPLFPIILSMPVGSVPYVTNVMCLHNEIWANNAKCMAFIVTDFIKIYSGPRASNKIYSHLSFEEKNKEARIDLWHSCVPIAIK